MQMPSSFTQSPPLNFSRGSSGGLSAPRTGTLTQLYHDSAPAAAVAAGAAVLQPPETSTGSSSMAEARESYIARIHSFASELVGHEDDETLTLPITPTSPRPSQQTPRHPPSPPSQRPTAPPHCVMSPSPRTPAQREAGDAEYVDIGPPCSSATITTMPVGGAAFDYASEAVHSLEQQYASSLHRTQVLQRMYDRLHSHNDHLEREISRLRDKAQYIQANVLIHLAAEAKKAHHEAKLLKQYVIFLNSSFNDSIAAMQQMILEDLPHMVQRCTGAYSPLLAYGAAGKLQPVEGRASTGEGACPSIGTSSAAPRYSPDHWLTVAAPRPFVQERQPQGDAMPLSMAGSAATQQSPPDGELGSNGYVPYEAYRGIQVALAAEQLRVVELEKRLSQREMAQEHRIAQLKAAHKEMERTLREEVTLLRGVRDGGQPVPSSHHPALSMTTQQRVAPDSVEADSHVRHRSAGATEETEALRPMSYRSLVDSASRGSSAGSSLPPSHFQQGGSDTSAEEETVEEGSDVDTRDAEVLRGVSRLLARNTRCVVSAVDPLEKHIRSIVARGHRNKSVHQPDTYSARDNTRRSRVAAELLRSCDEVSRSQSRRDDAGWARRRGVSSSATGEAQVEGHQNFLGLRQRIAHRTGEEYSRHGPSDRGCAVGVVTSSDAGSEAVRGSNGGDGRRAERLQVVSLSSKQRRPSRSAPRLSPSGSMRRVSKLSAVSRVAQGLWADELLEERHYR